MSDECDCFMCDGQGTYDNRVCQFCGGSGVSTKLDGLRVVPLLLILSTLAYIAYHIGVFHYD